MEQTVLFEEKLFLSPKDMNQISMKNTIDTILLRHLSSKLEGRCSKHGFVIPGSLEILSRSMGTIENGTYTGNILFHVQTQGRVYNPVNGTRLIGTIEKQNKMGLYSIYKNSIRILIPRDLHIGNEDFDKLVKGDTIEVELRKSRFQIHDPFILSVGVYIGRRSAQTSEEVVRTQQEETKDADEQQGTAEQEEQDDQEDQEEKQDDDDSKLDTFLLPEEMEDAKIDLGE
jgi:DNA-directed RNA polymerase subunit E'/Rpb7